MYALIRTYRVPAAQRDAVIRRVDVGWLEKVHEMHGFVSYAVVATAADQLTSLTVFLDQKTADLAGQASAEWVGQNLKAEDVELLTVSQGPVLVHGGQ